MFDPLPESRLSSAFGGFVSFIGEFFGVTFSEFLPELLIEALIAAIGLL